MKLEIRKTLFCFFLSDFRTFLTFGLNNMKLIIHGGFFSESQTNQEIKKAKQEALAEIVRLGYKYLQTHTAVETAVYAVSLLEDSELFNAGTGSQIQSDGKIRLSAALMDGKSMRFSGVINVEDVKNPICVAEKLLNYDELFKQ